MPESDDDPCFTEVLHLSWSRSSDFTVDEPIDTSQRCLGLAGPGTQRWHSVLVGRGYLAEDGKWHAAKAVAPM